MQPLMVFDLDGTLVDSVPDLASAVNRLMASRGLPPFARRQVAGFVGDGVRVLLDRAFAAHGTVPDARAVDEFLTDYGAHAADETAPYPGVRETLERFAAAGWRMAVCTNKPVVPARTLLDALDLSRHFAAVGGGDSFPVRKPDPGHLLATIAAAGGVPQHAIMAGDHHNDVLSAAGLGMPSIFAAWGYGPADTGDHATATARAFSELFGIAEKIKKDVLF
jgi:phosphoglycolate phosphatase